MNFLGRERDPRRQKEPRKKRKLERDPDRARPCGGSKHKLAAELHPLPATLRVATPIPKISLPGGWSWSFDRGRGGREQEKAIERLYGRYYLSNKSSFLPEEEKGGKAFFASQGGGGRILLPDFDSIRSAPPPKAEAEEARRCCDDVSRKYCAPPHMKMDS